MAASRSPKRIDKLAYLKSKSRLVGSSIKDAKIFSLSRSVCSINLGSDNAGATLEDITGCMPINKIMSSIKLFLIKLFLNVSNSVKKLTNYQLFNFVNKGNSVVF